MECEFYNEIAENNARRALREADIVDWFEVYEDSNQKEEQKDQTYGNN